MINKNFKLLIGYFMYTIFMGYVLSKGMQYDMHLRKVVSQTYNQYPRAIFMVFFPMLFGMLISLPKFINVWLNKPGVWRFNWIKLISVGIPVFLLTILPLVYFHSPLPLALNKFISLIWGLFGYSYQAPTISGIILGYLLLSILDKENQQ